MTGNWADVVGRGAEEVLVVVDIALRAKYRAGRERVTRMTRRAVGRDSGGERRKGVIGGLERGV